MIFHEDFGPGRKLNVEQANHLANEIISAAQNDCEATPKRRESYFQICVVDKNRRAIPLVRRLGPLRPQRHLALVPHGDSPDAETDEDEMTFRTLEHNRYKTGLEEIRWGNNRNDRVLGELLMLMGSIIQEQREETRSLRSEVREERKARDEADDKRVQREMMLEEKKFSIGLKKEGLRMGRNLLTGLFPGGAETEQPAPQNGHAESNGQSAQASQSPKPAFGRSTSRALVDNFLSDCEDTEGLMSALFGEAEEQNGKLVVTKPGIFTPQQVLIFVGVRGGFLSPDALDPLMPGSGDPVAITFEQISRAMEAGVTDGMGVALMELREVRKQVQEQRAAASAVAKTTTNPAPVATT
jgi:hypothetical protein